MLLLAEECQPKSLSKYSIGVKRVENATANIISNSKAATLLGSC